MRTRPAPSNLLLALPELNDLPVRGSQRLWHRGQAESRAAKCTTAVVPGIHPVFRYPIVLEVRVSTSQEAGEWTLEGPLSQVAEAAGARLRAETDEDADAARMAADALTRAATSAMEAGHPLTEIARAEARGKDTVRRALRADALKLVERSGARARETQAEH